MDMNSPLPGSDDDTLPCGADLDELQTRGTAPAGHERCPHCADALAALRTLDTLVRRAVEQEETADAVPGPLTARIMNAVRTELRPGPLVPLGEQPEDLWITHAAAARALRRAVDALPGIRAGGCRITPADPARPVRSGRLPRGPVQVRLEIAISPEQSVSRAADLVRGTVRDAMAENLGIDVRGIEIAVVDLFVAAGSASDVDGRRHDEH